MCIQFEGKWETISLGFSHFSFNTTSSHSINGLHHGQKCVREGVHHQCDFPYLHIQKALDTGIENSLLSIGCHSVLPASMLSGRTFHDVACSERGGDVLFCLGRGGSSKASLVRLHDPTADSQSHIRRKAFGPM